MSLSLILITDLCSVYIYSNVWQSREIYQLLRSGDVGLISKCLNYIHKGDPSKGDPSIQGAHLARAPSYL
jgi:hypothetical protein